MEQEESTSYRHGLKILKSPTLGIVKTKMMALVLAVVMMLAMGTVAFAEGEGDTTPTTTYEGTITVGTNFKGQTYKLYKIFDAVTEADRAADATDGISYKLMSGKTDFKATPTGGSEIDGSQWFKVDSAGNVSLADGVTSITFNDTFRQWAEAYGVKTGDDKTAASDNDANVKWTGLTSGYYFITTTTGSLVTVDSIEPDVTVNDKNTIPTVDKKITGASSYDADGKRALAMVGTDVTYTAEVTIGKGSKNVVFHDKMDEGLAFKGNDEVTVTASPAIEGSNWYTIKTTPDAGDTLTITFKDGIAENTKITITYKATVTKDALEDNPLENTAKVTYGDNNTSTQESKTKTYNAEISVIKYDGDKPAEGSETAAKYLAGAGFKLKNSEGKWYHLGGTATAPVVEWKDAETDGDKHVSVATDGKVPAFTGLPAGTYTLVETTVPAGYNKAADTQVVIKSTDTDQADVYKNSTNLKKVSEIENHTGTELPSTGGIGTTIFYIVGAILVIGAGVLLVARKRMGSK